MDLATIHFDYTSNRGEKTNRTVDVKAFGKRELEGYCHLRNKHRTFVLKYMEHCIDSETGQVVDDIFQFLVEKLKKYKCKNAIEEADKFFFLEHDFFLILIYVGRLSGQLAKRKKMAIVDACCELHGDRFISIHDLDFLCNGFSFFNTEEEFEKSINNIEKAKDKRREIIINATEKIAAIPKDPGKEMAMLDHLKARLS